MNTLWEIGDIVREIRLANGKCTQEAFAEMIDVSTETVSNIERGIFLLNTKTLISICEKCNVSADYILGNENNATPKNR